MLIKNIVMKNEKWIIFDLDGTLADIEDRRRLCTKENGKMDWNEFFDPINISLDKPNWPIINTLKAFQEAGYRIAIFSGRSARTEDATHNWLMSHMCHYDVLKMRPENHPYKFMPDEKLKSDWFGNIFANHTDEPEVICVFDDRQKVVDMWREIGLTCMQVAPGEWPPKNIL